MKKLTLKRAATGVWKAATSPQAILILNVIGLTLQLVRQVEMYRKRTENPPSEAVFKREGE